MTSMDIYIVSGGLFDAPDAFDTLQDAWKSAVSRATETGLITHIHHMGSEVAWISLNKETQCLDVTMKRSIPVADNSEMSPAEALLAATQ